MNITSRRSSALLLFVVAVLGIGSRLQQHVRPAPIRGIVHDLRWRCLPVVVHIENYAYKPADLKVKAGDKVTFVNDDKVNHRDGE